MKKLLLIGTCLLTLSACHTHNPKTGGALAGGLVGGLLGNTIGKGSGNNGSHTWLCSTWHYSWCRTVK